MGKKITKTLFDPLGIVMKDNSAEKAAARAQEAATRSQNEANQAAANMKANFNTDLNADNTTTVVAGGTADIASSTADDLKKKRALGLSSQLGLNV